ncbi:protein kinase domain-containing protein [Yinghuangia seranimata]|uniref:protein kinase domain-containing protein n=1 Tax=Yinghuangia seranimata TaxID=408067 RepID=UPI00248B8C47|nr:protein kinase [Yinghuangia seranimata]MDI2131797.1 protein kinase [Yinghuangia seranimata]
MRVLAERYELQELVGRGGMGEVWKGADRELGRTVAVKVLPAELTRHEEFRTRFRREARTVAALSHQGVATLYDVGEDTGGPEATPFLVMEYVDGRTLADVLRDGPLPVARAVAVARDIADTLVHSHGHGLVHRDIKPSNVMLTAAGGVKVLDFGIAKALAETTTRLTATGMTVGTPAYLSPEQIDGVSVDGRSDLYSLGCVLYELLTGRPPFTGDSPFVVMNQHLMKGAPAPSGLRPQVPEFVDAVTLRLLAKRPEERYDTAAQLRGALEDVQAELRGGTAAVTTPATTPATAAAPPPTPAPATAAPATPPPPSGHGADGPWQTATATAAPAPPRPRGEPATPAPATSAVPPPRPTLHDQVPSGTTGAAIPAPPYSPTAHAATRIVPPGMQVRPGTGGRWAVRFRVTADGMVALFGIGLIPLTYFSVDADGFNGHNYLTLAAAVLAPVALLWSARIAALIAWMPTAVLTGAMFAFTHSASRDYEDFPRDTYGRQMGWEVGDLTSRYAAVALPLMLITLFALGAFLRSRSSSALYAAVFWVAGMLTAFSCGSWSSAAAVRTGWLTLAGLVIVCIVQEAAARRRLPSAN